MSALRTDPSIDCPAQLADLPNYDQHHPLAPVRSRPWGPCGFQEMTLKVASRDANVSVIAERFQGG